MHSDGKSRSREERGGNAKVTGVKFQAKMGWDGIGQCRDPQVDAFHLTFRISTSEQERGGRSVIAGGLTCSGWECDVDDVSDI